MKRSKKEVRNLLQVEHQLHRYQYHFLVTHFRTCITSLASFKNKSYMPFNKLHDT